MSTDFYNKVDTLVKRDTRYHPDAYEFMMQALWYTQKKLNRKGDVSGRELSEGARDYCLDQYGPMAKAVLAHWGIKSTEDFGNIVFNMIEAGIMGKSEKDTQEDFTACFDFESAFNAFANIKRRK